MNSPTLSNFLTSLAKQYPTNELTACAVCSFLTKLYLPLFCPQLNCGQTGPGLWLQRTFAVCKHIKTARAFVDEIGHDISLSKRRLEQFAREEAPVTRQG